MGKELKAWQIVEIIFGGLWGFVSLFLLMLIISTYSLENKTAYRVLWALGFPYMFCAHIVLCEEEFHDNYLLAFLYWHLRIFLGISIFIFWLRVKWEVVK